MKKLAVLVLILLSGSWAFASEGDHVTPTPPRPSPYVRSGGFSYDPLDWGPPSADLDTTSHFYGQGVIQISLTCAYGGWIEVNGESLYHTGPSRLFTITLHAPFSVGDCLGPITTGSFLSFARSSSASLGTVSLDIAPLGVVSMTPRTASVRAFFAAAATVPRSTFSLELLDYFVHLTTDGSIEIDCMWRLS